MRARQGLPRGDLISGLNGPARTHAVYASPGGSPHKTQDSLPAVGQTLPGGLVAHWVPPKGFFDASYIASLLSQAFPGASALRSETPRRVRVAVFGAQVTSTEVSATTCGATQRGPAFGVSVLLS